MNLDDVLCGPEIQAALRSIGSPSREGDIPRIKRSIQYYDVLVDKRTLELGLGEDGRSVAWRGMTGLIRKGMLKSSQHRLESARYTSALLHSLLAPVRRLPPEILSEIFVLCLPGGPFIAPSRKHAPLLLLRISKSWRDIALATPNLWTSLEVGSASWRFAARESHKKRHIALVSIMEFWLSRAGESSLSLSIRDELLASEAIRSFFNRVSRRWRHVRLEVPNLKIPFLETQGCPVLETFTLNTPWDLTQSQVRNVSLTLQQAPRLRSFVWENDRQSGRAVLPVDFRCSQWTTLSLNVTVTLQQCVDIFQHSPNLIDVAFQKLHWDAEEFVPPPLVNLHHLRSLVLGSEYDVSPCLDWIHVPVLRELVLTLRIWPHKALLSLLRRSRCPLESLDLYFPVFSEPEFIECLEATQTSLRELTLQIDDRALSATITDPLLDRLTYRRRGEFTSCLCPKLELIALYNCVSGSDVRFEAMIRSRLGSNQVPTADSSCVAKMKIVEISEQEVDLIKALEPLRREGLILKIYSPRTGRLIRMTPEDAARLEELRAEGLTLRVYHPTTGQFLEVTDLA